MKRWHSAYPVRVRLGRDVSSEKGSCCSRNWWCGFYMRAGLERGNARLRTAGLDTLRTPPARPVPGTKPGPKPDPEPQPGSEPDVVPPFNPEPEPETTPNVVPPVPEPEPAPI